MDRPRGHGARATCARLPGRRSKGATRGTITSCGKRATQTALAAVALVASVLGFLTSARAGPEVTEEATPGVGREARPANAGYVELQRQLNELRSELLDEREQRIGRQLEANGAVLVVLGIVIGIGGLWFCAKFRAIASEATIGAAATRRYVLVPPGLLPGSARIRGPSDEASRPLPLLVSAELEAELGTRTSANGSLRRSSPMSPRLQVFRYPLSPDDRGSPADRAGLGLDDVGLHRLEETIADCTEAIRLDPDSPRLYLERAGARASLERYEEAVADYDRAIGLDPDHAAAYLGRCHAKSELGRHEDAIEDYDHAVHLDPASTSASSDG